MDRLPAADLQLVERTSGRLSGAEESELLVEFRLPRRNCPGGDDRSGRWKESDKTECGLHTSDNIGINGLNGN